MKTGKRFGLSAIEKSDVWRRWKAGETLHEIGRAFDKPHASIRCLLLPRGGIPPAVRRRSRLALTRSEREDISRGIASGSSIREIARTSNYTALLPAATHRAAASALSSGRVLKAIAAPGAALRIALMTTSNNARFRGGKRTPPPMTTQS